MLEVQCCECGIEPVVWEESDDRGFESLLNIEKIECPACGHIVYGSDEESILDWNSRKYDD